MQKQQEKLIVCNVVVSSAIPAMDQPCKCDLASEVLRRFGELRLQVTGASMLPSLWPGDLLTVRSAHLSEVSRGDIVLFFRDSRFFVHRALRVFADHLLTQGDGLATPDLPVDPNELLGRVVSVARHGVAGCPPPPGTFGGLLAFGVRRSTLFCNILLRFHCASWRLRRAFAVVSRPQGEACPS